MKNFPYKRIPGDLQIIEQTWKVTFFYPLYYFATIMYTKEYVQFRFKQPVEHIEQLDLPAT